MLALIQVDADDARLARLVQLYVHEWSGRIPIAIGADARYDDGWLAAFADRTAHAAYLIVDDGVPLGFALVIDEDDGAVVEEFFVIAGARRRGVGLAAARAVFATRPGRWTLTVRPENPEALAFWRRAAPGAEETVEPLDDGIARTRLSFVA